MEGSVNMEGLTFTHEEGGVTVNLAQHQAVNEILDHCLVGKFLADRPVRTHIMKERLANLCRPVKGVMITPIESNRFLFQFFHNLDMGRVISDGPWSFDNFMLALRKVYPGEDPLTVPLNIVEMWVQIHNLPYGFMCKAIGELIGSYLGNFLEYDEDNNWGPWRKYMRIKVALDVNVPLKKDWAIRKDGGDWVKVMFKCKRLGKLLKSEPGRNGGATVNRWLRDGRGLAGETAINGNNVQRETAATVQTEGQSSILVNKVINGALIVPNSTVGTQLRSPKSGTVMVRSASGVIMRAPNTSSEILLPSPRPTINLNQKIMSGESNGSNNMNASAIIQPAANDTTNNAPKKRFRAEEEGPGQVTEVMKIDEASATKGHTGNDVHMLTDPLFTENIVMAGPVDQACHQK
ncbi:hypothetical protein A2U01_0001862 [Trifolium medium]|uniref:DUF4283 domain-containing protein n=1 Tax=Trifolium medium TaxID=97028 RepID=A0A392M244_9FABA|nr:hypothetical protein [Trifolium medium]